MEAIIENLSSFADLVCPWIDQRTILHVFVRQSFHRVDRQQRTFEQDTALLDKAIRVTQELLDRRRLVVLDAVGPERVVVGVTL